MTRRSLTMSIFATLFSFPALAATMCPDGSYVGGSTCTMAPDGTYVSGGSDGRATPMMAPNGGYYGGYQGGGSPQMAPNGSYVPAGQMVMCPDGTYHVGRCVLTPNGSYVGE